MRSIGRGVVILGGLVVICVSAWWVAARISPDAVSMAVGMLFSVLAGVPTTLLMVAGQRREPYEEQEYRPRRQWYGDVEDDGSNGQAAQIQVHYGPHYEVHNLHVDGDKTVQVVHRDGLPPLPR